MGKVHGVCQNRRRPIRRILVQSQLQQEPVCLRRMLEQKRVHELGQERSRKKRTDKKHGSDQRQGNGRRKTSQRTNNGKQRKSQKEKAQKVEHKRKQGKNGRSAFNLGRYKVIIIPIESCYNGQQGQDMHNSCLVLGNITWY